MPDALKSIIDVTVSLGAIILGVFYVAIVLWTYKDARRRIDDPILIATSVATSMIPIAGVFIYMLLRPPEYLADVRERELEIRAMERSLGRQERCPYCRSHIEADYRACPVCAAKLREACTGCDKPLDPRWAMCPYCETEVPRTAGRGGRDLDQGARPPKREQRQPTGSSRRPDSGGRGGEGKPSSKPTSDRPRRSEPVRSTKRDADVTTSPAEPTPSMPSTDDPLRTEPFQSLSPATQSFLRPPVADQPTMAGTTPSQTRE